MINYLLLTVFLMIGFSIIQLAQYIYIRHLVNKNADEDIKRVSFWGTLVSSIMIAVGVIMIAVVFFTRHYVQQSAAPKTVAVKKTTVTAAPAPAAQAPAAQAVAVERQIQMGVPPQRPVQGFRPRPARGFRPRQGAQQVFQGAARGFQPIHRFNQPQGPFRRN